MRRMDWNSVPHLEDQAPRMIHMKYMCRPPTCIKPTRPETIWPKECSATIKETKERGDRKLGRRRDQIASISSERRRSSSSHSSWQFGESAFLLADSNLSPCSRVSSEPAETASSSFASGDHMVCCTRRTMTGITLLAHSSFFTRLRYEAKRVLHSTKSVATRSSQKDGMFSAKGSKTGTQHATDAEGIEPCQSGSK